MLPGLTVDGAVRRARCLVPYITYRYKKKLILQHWIHHLKVHFEPQPTDIEWDKPANPQRESTGSVFSTTQTLPWPQPPSSFSLLTFDDLQAAGALHAPACPSCLGLPRPPRISRIKLPCCADAGIQQSFRRFAPLRLVLLPWFHTRWCVHQSVLHEVQCVTMHPVSVVALTSQFRLTKNNCVKVRWFFWRLVAPVPECKIGEMKAALQSTKCS